MASARKTGTNENITTYDSAGGKDYSNIVTWEGDTDNNLVSLTQAEVLECYAGTHSQSGVNIGGATTNTSYFRIIRPATGQGHDGTPNTGVIFSKTSAGNYFQNEEFYFSLQDVSVFLLYTGSLDYVAIKLTQGWNATAIGCFAKARNTGTGNHWAIIIGNYSASSKVIDCVAYESDNGIYCNNAGAWYFWQVVYNCSAVNNIGQGIRAGGWAGTVHFKNNLSSGNGTDFVFDAGGRVLDISYCASSDDTADDAGGVGHRTNQAFSFVDTGNNDYHLAPNDTGAKDFGLDLSLDAFFPFDDDIDGVLWDSVWSIGADKPPSIVIPGSVAFVFGEIVQSGFNVSQSGLGPVSGTAPRLNNVTANPSKLADIAILN